MRRRWGGGTMVGARASACLEFDARGFWAQDAAALGERRVGRRAGERVPLHHFLRLIAGRAVVAGDRAHATNDDLVNNLRHLGVLSTCALGRGAPHPVLPHLSDNPILHGDTLLSGGHSGLPLGSMWL